MNILTRMSTIMHSDKTIKSLVLTIILIIPFVSYTKGKGSGQLLPTDYTLAFKEKLEVTGAITAEDLQKIGISRDTKNFLVKATQATVVAVPFTGTSLAFCLAGPYISVKNEKPISDPNVYLTTLAGFALAGVTYLLVSHIFKEDVQSNAAKILVPAAQKSANTTSLAKEATPEKSLVLETTERENHLKQHAESGNHNAGQPSIHL